MRFCTELKQTVLNLWYVKTMGVRRVVEKGIFSSLEMELRTKIFAKT